MSIPIIQTRLHVPPLPVSYLPRPRLDRLWEEWNRRRLVQVTAGAGFGKTSLIAAHAASHPECYWYSLDEADADPPTFCAHLSAAVFRSEEREMRWSPDDQEPARHDRLIADLVRFLGRKSGVMLVIDDLQLVTGSPPVLRLIERLIRFLPEKATMVLASREPVALNTGKLRTLGAVARLSAEELKFNADEVQALYARHFPDSRLSERLCGRVMEKTEGWAAGLEILFQTLRRPSTRDLEQALQRLEKSEDGWFPYFAEEVVQGLDQQKQDFLIRSSVLPHMDPDRCNRVLGIDNSGDLLEELHQRNLFTFAESGDRQGYRYHHLFRDFLRGRLVRSMSAAAVRKLWRRTARELERAGAWAEAAAAHTEGGNHAATLKLAARLGEDLLTRGQYSNVARALNGIPKALLHKHPKALFVLGRLSEIHGQWEEAEALYRRALRISPAGKGRLELVGLVAQLEMRRGDFTATIRRCRKALGESKSGEIRIRGRLLALLGISASAQGRLDEGEDHFREALALFHRKSDSLGEGRIRYLLAANVHYLRGEFRRARDEARRALLIFGKQKDPRRICHSLGVLGFVTAGAALEREARELSEEALRLAETLDYSIVIGYCHWTLGRCALISGNTMGAIEHLETALEYGERLGETALSSNTRLTLAEATLVSGNRHQARCHAEEALVVAKKLKDPLLQALCQVILGRTDGSAQQGKGNHWWRSAEKKLRRVGAKYDLHRLLLYRLTEGDVPENEAPGLMSELLAGSAGLDHDFLFLLIEPERSVQVLAEAYCREIETSYVEQLLARLGQRAVPALARLAAASSEKIRSRIVDLLVQIGGDEARMELTILSRSGGSQGEAAVKAASELERSPAVPLRIQILGPLIVTMGKRTLTLKEWKSARSLRLFQLLLVNRFRWIPRDTIIEALWPEAEPDKGANNLRQAIHLLRRTLEPELKKPGHSSYIRYHNESCRLEAGSGSYYDVEELEQKLAEAERLWNSGKQKRARPLFEEALGLFRGSFLEESPYEEFAVLEREQFRDRFVRTIVRLIEALSPGKEWEEIVPLCRRGLSQDSFHEDFHWHLVHALSKLGHRREALAAYHRYEKVMVRELDLLPSERMKSLADKVVSIGAHPKP